MKREARKRCVRAVQAGGAMCLSMFAMAPVNAASFVEFESGQVRPVALSPDKNTLFVANAPDNRLEIFDVSGAGMTKIGSVPVGLEPVAVAARTNSEVWVVNHLSDSISIVDVSSTPPRVTRTLLVGDEPRDIIFAGTSGNRAFITTAHRGQHRTDASLDPVTGLGSDIVGMAADGDPGLTTEGIGRADVWVFDATSLGATLGGTPLGVVVLFGDTPRALAASPDGSLVYAAVFHSGNRTTTVAEGAVCDGGAGAPTCSPFGVTFPGGLPLPNDDNVGNPAPETGLIVKYNAAMSQWQDPLGRNWNTAVKFNLPDYDVFAINADANPPSQTGLPGGQAANYSTVGTILLNMAVNPMSGKIYVSNLDSPNHVRFEGPGTRGFTTVRGHLGESRISVLDTSTVTSRHLNKHINYAVVPSPLGVKDNSLATPVDMAITSDGSTLYVAAFGSSKVGVFDVTELENDTFTPSSGDHITVSGGGPIGLALDDTRSRLYVLTRFDNSVSLVDTSMNAETEHVSLHNPEPAKVVAGRPFLYDANLTSSNGETACASCHIFGDLDSLAWDLGNPDEELLENLNPFQVPDILNLSEPDHHPLKGPMTTQSLRGMANHGPMHWRGDRSGANDTGNAADAFDENRAFKRFNPAFVGLVGRDTVLTDAEMAAFTDFILEVTYPPNPIRALDNSLTASQLAGRTRYFGANSDVLENCDGCHKLDTVNGFFGSDGDSSFENEPQLMKVAHLRNVYQKIGMFGMPRVSFFNGGNNGNQGDQIRGFGLLHDGSTDTVLRFLNATVFNINGLNPGGFAAGVAGDPQRREMEAFVLAVDTNLKPIVGQQITLTDTNSGTVGPRIALLLARAAADDCDVVVKGTSAGEARGWYRLADGTFQADRVADVPVSDATLQAVAATVGQELTYTAVPVGSGERIGVDRDYDGIYDRDELDGGSDPEDDGCTTTDVITKVKLKIGKNAAPSGDEKLIIKGEWIESDLLPAIDPIANGITVQLRDADGAILFSRVVPPGAGDPGWSVNGSGTTWIFRDSAGTLASGITKVTVQQKTGNLLRMKVKGKEADFTVAASALPLRLTLIAGDGSNGQCAEVAFYEEGIGIPECSITPSLNTVKCK